jgi:hypothetical protein
LEWDERKRADNKEKHGLDFEDAAIVFSGKTATFEDDGFDYGETRYVTLGQIAGIAVHIAWTPRPGAARIISFRKAKRKEREIYATKAK